MYVPPPGVAGVGVAVGAGAAVPLAGGGVAVAAGALLLPGRAST